MLVVAALARAAVAVRTMLMLAILDVVNVYFSLWSLYFYEHSLVMSPTTEPVTVSAAVTASDASVISKREPKIFVA
jgi:hypothetical protein